ncbi:MAG: hypothetical protein GVY17_03075 [Cyanobacteria bacterium]|jgi:polyhydroxyalkanoate synthesis regulator phasin|nr:hypothetical protein [Cyanobacteria bacterium GSL.Bin21]
MTSDWSNFTKQQLIDAIGKMEKNPSQKAEILGNLGIATVGGVGGGAAAAFLGSSSVAIPLVTALTGATITVAAAPVFIGAGAIVGVGAMIGATQLAKNTGKHEGKRQEILREVKEKLREFEKKERSKTVTEDDKIKLYSELRKAMSLKKNPMSKEDAAEIMNGVETGKISLEEAYRIIKDLLDEHEK